MLHSLDIIQQKLYININMQQKEFYTTSEAADIIGLSRSQVFRKLKAGKIPYKKVGRYHLIPRSFIDSFLGKLAQEDKKEIKSAVKKTIREYGEVIKMLGDK